MREKERKEKMSPFVFFFFLISNFRNTRSLRKVPYGLGKASDCLAKDSNGLGNMLGGLRKVLAKINHVLIFVVVVYIPF